MATPVAPVSLFEDDILPYVMWPVAISTLLVNIVVLILGVVRKQEIPVDAFLIHNLLFCYLLLSLHPFVVLTMNILTPNVDQTITDALCSFSSFVGVATSTMCMWAMVTLASSFLLRLLLPRRFKNLKSYLNALRIVLIAEWVLVGLFAVVPLIPFPVFAEAQKCTRQYLCLPLHTIPEDMWVYTLSLASMDGLSIIVLLMLIVVTACQLHRQQRNATGVTPMEARVIQKNSALVKRVGLMMLSTVAFRFPGVVAVFGANLSVEIPTVVFQWVFGIVQPFSGIIGPVIYVFYAGLEDTTLEVCWRSCRKKAVKGGSALRIGLGQLTGNTPASRNSTQGKGTEADIALPNGIGPHPHDTLPRGSNRAPGEATWVESVVISGKTENFGIVEWQTSNGSPRRGLLQMFHPDNYQQWKTEALTLSRLQSKQFHPHIVECLWHSNSSKTRMERGAGKEATRPVYLERYICTSYYQHGNLQQYLPKFLEQYSESILHTVACQISKGLAFLHANNVVHTRLESTNIKVGGNPESKIKVVISNFTSAIDYAKPPRQEPPVYRPGTEKGDDGKTDLMMPRGGGKKGKERGAEPESTRKSEFSNDVRSFAILLMEMMAWLKQKKVDQGLEDVRDVYRKSSYWEKADSSIIGARLAGEDCIKSSGGVSSVTYSPHVSHDRLDVEAGQGADSSSKDAGDGTSSPKRVYSGNQAYVVDEMRSRRAMSDAGVYRKILSKRVDRNNLPQRPKSGIADARDTESSYIVQVKSKSSRESLTDDGAVRVAKNNRNEAHCSNSSQYVQYGRCKSDCNRNHLIADGNNLKDNPQLASTFPRRSMVSSDVPKSDKRHSLCSSDSGISSPRNSMRSNKSGRPGQDKKAEANLIELNDKIESAMSDSEIASRNSAVSKLRGMLDAATQSLKASGESTDGDSCQEDDAMLDYSSSSREERKSKSKQAHSCPSDTGSESSKSDSEKLLTRSRNKSSDQSSDTDKGEETDQESEKPRSSADTGETRSASSLSKFYVRKKSVTPFTSGIPECLTPPCSRPVSRASSAASLLDGPDFVYIPNIKSSPEDGKSYRKYSLGAMKHEGIVNQASSSRASYAYSNATLPKDHQVRGRCRTMDSKSMTMSRAANLNDNQVVMGRNGWGYSHLMAVHGGAMGNLSRPLPQAMHNGDHFFVSTVPSGVTKHHVAYTQQLLDTLPCLKVGVGQEQMVGAGDAHLAMTEWLSVIRESDSCLNKQLLNILKACWTREPCPEAGDVHCMLDNCVTEVPL